MKRHYIIPIFVPHRGCPHDCIFCNQKKITGQGQEVDDMFVEDEIAKYLETIEKSENTVEVSFYGGSFTGLPMEEQIRLLKPAKRALDLHKIDAIRLSTRPDYINEAILDNLKEYGVSIIELGVQSMDDEVLRLSNRGHTKEDVYKASKLIISYNFTLGLQMMVGLPGDNEEKDMRTAKEFIKMNPSMVRIYPALVIKDTYMEQLYISGKYKPLDLYESVEICSKLYLEFEKASIHIIRIGLQPTENIRPGKDLISGPFHPAYRELVESNILNNIIMYLNDKYSIERKISINPRTVSKLYADKKKYFNRMTNITGTNDIKVTADENIPVNTIMAYVGESSLTMSIKEYSLIK